MNPNTLNITPLCVKKKNLLLMLRQKHLESQFLLQYILKYISSFYGFLLNVHGYEVLEFFNMIC